MVTIHNPSAPLVISCGPPRRTCTFCASEAATRKVTRRSACTQGYGAPGIFSEDGLHPSAPCPQHIPPRSRGKRKHVIRLLRRNTGVVVVWTHCGFGLRYHRHPEKNRIGTVYGLDPQSNVELQCIVGNAV